MTTWLIQTQRINEIMVYIFRPYLFTNPHLMYMTPSKGMSNISFGAQDVRRYIILCSLYLNKIIFASVPRHAKITYYVQYSTHTILFTFRDSQKMLIGWMEKKLCCEDNLVSKVFNVRNNDNLKKISDVSFCSILNECIYLISI